MNHLSLKAEKIHKEISIKNLIIKKLKWYRNPTYIHHAILFLTAIPLFSFLNSTNFAYVFLIWGLNIAIVQYFLLSHINKLISKKHKIKLKRKGLFWVFSNVKYKRKDRKLYHKKMVNQQVLKGNSDDIDILETIEEDVNNNTIDKITSYPIQSFFKKGAPITTALFILFATLILDNSTNFESDAKLVLGYGIIFLLSIFISLYANFLILEVLNIKYRKQQRFLSRITRLKIFLKFKYQHNK